MLSAEEVRRRRAELEKRRALKKKYRRRRIISNSFVLVIGLILMFLAAQYSYKQGIVRKGPVPADRDGKLRVLFLGTDEKQESSVRADTIMLASVDPKTGEAGIISIPRDTRVWVSSRQRWERLNATYAHGGPLMTMHAVSELLQVPIPYYVHTDFQGFQELVDILGGVEMDIKKEMHYVDQAQDLEIHISPGRQTLDGDKALQYVRYRDRLGDVALVDPFENQYDGRVERQRQFFEALIAKTLSSAALTKLPRLMSRIFKVVDTNLPWDEVLSLVLSASKFSGEKIRTAVLPGNSQVIGDAWYWIPNEKKARRVVDGLILGKPEPLQLVILNGNGRRGAAQEVADLLNAFGYNIVSLGNADHFDFAETKIVVPSWDEKRVQGLAEYLGASIETVEAGKSEVTIIIGKDFEIKDRSVEI
ncbi:MAG: LCP family protein [Firmicutes bacterium]|nr:LCP family protein [Bacillota bacterium]